MQEYFPYFALSIVAFLVSFKHLNEYEEAVVLKLGEFSRTIKEGFFLTIPGMEKVIKVDTRASIEEVIFDSLNLSFSVYYQVVDVKKAVINILNYKDGLNTLTHKLISEEDLFPEKINDDLEHFLLTIQNKLTDQTHDWGLKILKLESGKGF